MRRINAQDSLLRAALLAAALSAARRIASAEPSSSRCDLSALAARDEQRCDAPRLQLRFLRSTISPISMATSPTRSSCSMSVAIISSPWRRWSRRSRRHIPTSKARIYWETIPPGLLVKQIEAGGTITSGNMTWTAKPDAYFAGLKKVDALIDQGLLTGPAVPYATNTLTIMVPSDNPGHVNGLADLARPDLRLAMPNPEFEGIARQIEASLKKAGGQAFARRGLQDQGGRRQHDPDPYPSSTNAALSDAGTRRGRRHLAIRSDVPGADR